MATSSGSECETYRTERRGSLGRRMDVFDDCDSGVQISFLATQLAASVMGCVGIALAYLFFGFFPGDVTISAWFLWGFTAILRI